MMRDNFLHNCNCAHVKLANHYLVYVQHTLLFRTRRLSTSSLVYRSSILGSGGETGLMGLITMGVSGYTISSSTSECVEESASVSSSWAAAIPDPSGFTSMFAATNFFLSLHLE
ncbi:hypothetical protein EB796_013156 [Bugula neritina]|uniref:Uncharacterized protein n=1 Tax=Bugula neritina TaxID=10212 RepID=A0A7J7JQB0_BUGNE|nr:hypothetical protein EB796_013156 [Bugula neritina]